MVGKTVLFCSTKIFKKTKAIFVWYPNDELMTDDELVVARNFFKKLKHACLYIQNKFPRGFRLLNHV